MLTSAMAPVITVEALLRAGPLWGEGLLEDLSPASGRCLPLLAPAPSLSRSFCRLVCAVSWARSRYWAWRSRKHRACVGGGRSGK